MFKRIAMVFAISFVVIALLSVITDKKSNAEQNSGNDSAEILKKVDALLQGQKEILKQIADIKTQLNIIQLRVSQQQ